MVCLALGPRYNSVFPILFSFYALQSNLSAYDVQSGSSPADLHGMWYPTIRRTLVCLSRLYRCVEKPVFQGLAQEAIVCCCQNVEEATQMISKNKVRILNHYSYFKKYYNSFPNFLFYFFQSLLDGYLFQIKHILILREQIAPFQVDFTITEMSLDFNQLKSAGNISIPTNRLQVFIVFI